jgi:hypothetical protein
VRIRAQESYTGALTNEQVSYLAVEAGSGTIDNHAYSAGTLSVTQAFTPQALAASLTNSVFFATAQTYNNGDPFAIRMRKPAPPTVELSLEEEQSADPEVTPPPRDGGLARHRKAAGRGEGGLRVRDDRSHASRRRRVEHADAGQYLHHAGGRLWPGDVGGHDACHGARARGHGHELSIPHRRIERAGWARRGDAQLHGDGGRLLRDRRPALGGGRFAPNGMLFEAGASANNVTHTGRTLPYARKIAGSVVLGDIQT